LKSEAKRQGKDIENPEDVQEPPLKLEMIESKSAQAVSSNRKQTPASKIKVLD